MESLCSQIVNSKSAFEVGKLLTKAKSQGSLHYSPLLVHSAIRKLMHRETLDIELCHKLVRDLGPDSLETLDKLTLGSVFNCAYQARDYNVAFRVFQLMREPNDTNLNHYILMLKNVRASRMSSKELVVKVNAELSNIWNLIESLGFGGNVKLLMTLFSALSYNKGEQRKLVLQVISKPAHKGYDCGALACFLKFCASCRDKRLAGELWNWGKDIRDMEVGSFGYFSAVFQYLNLVGASVCEFKALWNSVIEHGQNERLELVTSMCTSLSIDPPSQKQFIHHIISNPPNASFSCGLLGGFLKHCSESQDEKLAKLIWTWSESIRHREMGTFSYFSISFQYLDLVGGGKRDAFIELWKQVVQFGLDDRVELITSMCSSLCIDPNDQEQFISHIISKPPLSTFRCGLLGCFLKHCSIQNNPALAHRIWSWGRDIRKRERGCTGLSAITIQYISICAGMGDVNVLEAVWSEAEQCNLTHFKEVKGAYLNALSSNGAIDSVIKVFDTIKLDCVDEQALTSTLNALSHAGEDDKALALLRRFQTQNPSAVTIISYSSVIDAYCRNGNFEAALQVLEEATSNGHKPDAITWRSILSPCRQYKNLELALQAFKELRGLEKDADRLATCYVLMADVYRACGDEGRANELHLERLSLGLFKKRGGVQLAVEPGGKPISFFVGEIPSGFGPDIASTIDSQLEEWTLQLQPKTPL